MTMKIYKYDLSSPGMLPSQLLSVDKGNKAAGIQGAGCAVCRSTTVLQMGSKAYCIQRYPQVLLCLPYLPILPFLTLCQVSTSAF
jgi:hypothetical protein